MKAVEAEDSLDFTALPLLQQRYQLLRVLSKKGNTTVYRASDLFTLQPCVVKTHRIQGTDSEARVKAVAAECEKLKHLRHDWHANIIQLRDHFPQETASLATVWEYYEGEALDGHLRRNGPVPEKEARGIALQLLSALRWADNRGHRIRGQDMRSSRLKLKGGEVKVAGVALLGPACFPNSRGTTGRALVRSPTANSEVDAPLTSLGPRSHTADSLEDDPLKVVDTSSAMYAIGETLHEVLFNKRPEEPEGLAEIDSEPRAVIQLPDQPRISAECREFLLRLLDRYRRLTVQEAYSDPFIALPRRQR